MLNALRVQTDASTKLQKAKEKFIALNTQMKDQAELIKKLEVALDTARWAYIEAKDENRALQNNHLFPTSGDVEMGNLEGDVFLRQKIFDYASRLSHDASSAVCQVAKQFLPEATPKAMPTASIHSGPALSGPAFGVSALATEGGSPDADSMFGRAQVQRDEAQSSTGFSS